MGNYTSIELVGSRLRTAFSDTTTPSASDVEDIISEAEATIEDYAGRVFTSGNTVTNEYHDYNGEGLLIVKNPGLLTVTSIEYTTDNYATWTTLAAANYQVDTTYDTIYIRPSTSSGVSVSIPSGYRNVRITYTHGKAAVPLRIQRLATDMAVLEVVKTQLNSSTSSSAGSISVGPIALGALAGTSVQYLTNLRDTVNERLENLQQSRIRTTVGKRWD
jgi:hypothetical protein